MRPGIAASEGVLDLAADCQAPGPARLSTVRRSAILVAVVSEDRLFCEVLAAALSAGDGVAVTPGLQHGGEGADVVLVDADCDSQWALVRVREAWASWPAAKVIAVGLEREDESVVDLVEAGAQGYVLRGATPDEMVGVIRSVHQGATPCSPRVAASVVARIAHLSRTRSVPAPREIEPLTAREREVLALLAAGLSNKEVGQRLRISVQTVKNHVHRILEKLQVHRRREAVRLAYDHGLLAEPGEAPPLRAAGSVGRLGLG